MGFEAYSDEELEEIAGTPDASGYSDEELEKLAGGSTTKKSLASSAIDVADQVAGAVRGPFEAGAALLSGVVGAVGGGLAGLGTIVATGGDYEAAKAVEEGVANQIQFKPVTPLGKDITNRISPIVSSLGEIGKEAVELPLESWNAPGIVRYPAEKAAEFGAYGVVKPTMKGIRNVKDYIAELSKEKVAEKPVDVMGQPETIIPERPSTEAKIVPKETPVEPVAKQTFENKQFDQIVNEFDRNGDLKNATWEKVTVPIESLRDNNKSLFDGKWNLGTEGSKTKGEIILDNEGKIIDGNHRTFEALKRGDTEITIVRPKAEQTELGGTPSGVATRIEAKAIERGLTDTGFDSLAEYDPTTLKAQAKKASDLINGDFEKTRRIIRGEEPIPEGVNAGPIVIAMEEHLKNTKDPKVAYDLAYELANSPLDTKISKAGQELSMNRGREADSFTSRIAEVKKARESQAGPDITKRTEVVKKLKDETSKVHLPPEELSWNKFLNSIKC